MTDQLTCERCGAVAPTLPPKEDKPPAPVHCLMWKGTEKHPLCEACRKAWAAVYHQLVRPDGFPADWATVFTDAATKFLAEAPA